MPAFHFKDDSIGFKADPFEWSYIYGRSLKRSKTKCTSEISNAYVLKGSALISHGLLNGILYTIKFILKKINNTYLVLNGFSYYINSNLLIFLLYDLY